MDGFNTEKIKILMQNDPAAAAEEIKEYVENKNNTPLNIAITGESGAGKSTFVNYFRGMTNDDEEGVAPTGCTETTKKSSRYPHPMNPDVILWDLPGIGTTKFPADEYLKTMEFEKFDFFIIISSTRFKENDVKLAKAIQKMEKKFYFVRSKIDNDVGNEKRGKKNFNEKETLKKIREDCIQGLQEGFKSPQVFLISSFELKQYDFLLLHETLERELSEHKSHAFLMAMPNINLEVINKKKEALQSQIKYYAAASAAGAALPIPGISIAVDLPLIVKAVTTFVVSFGLDIKSLEKLAKSTGVPVTDLKEEIKSPLAGVEITKALIVKCFGQMGNGALNKVVVVAKFIPILFGIPATMALSSTATYKALDHILNILAEDALRVFKRSLGLDSSV